MSENTNSQVPKKIVWLASYPKSGNTWFRAFLTVLVGNGDLDINFMKTDGIFSSKVIFNDATDTDSTYLYDKEIKNAIPDVFTFLATEYLKDKLFIKVHDAYTVNENKKPIIPEAPTYCALYFIRNPLDVVGSFANHNAGPIDHAIAIMNNPQGALAKQKGNFNVNNQFKQLMFSWSGHVESWTQHIPFPVLVIKYEDMLADSFATFSKAVKFMGLEKTEAEILKAIEDSKFDKLKAQEKEKGFGEKNKESKSFFRSGKSGGWKDELTFNQVHTICQHHHKVMLEYGYNIPVIKDG